ncbi:TrbC/VirB2 family protein [uncultured Fusobacterium sp.]|uniref:TrbC/VirB2 family protein n=1 Tax=uncultured Fusobacterium sp. TaxID=159267 RepID=UPI0015A6F2BB|nr:TrbC/VirB2 family protein [uncultured Fusobacterium sp.]
MKKNKLLLLTVFLILATGAMASSTNMPWEGPLDKLLKSLTGPVARTVIILALAGTGGTLAFGETPSAIKRMLQIVFGATIIFAAGSWGPTFFGFTGSALL